MKINLKLRLLFSYRKAAFSAMLLCCMFFISCQKDSIQSENATPKKTQTPVPTPTPPQTFQSPKQKQAEEAVDKIQQRFYETLDFETIWKEGYVKDEKLRHLEVEAIIFKYLDHNIPPEKISHKAKEHAYIAMGNFWQLMSAEVFTADATTVDKVYDELEKPYESMAHPNGPAISDDDLKQKFTNKMNEMSNILRDKILPGNVNKDEYNRRLKKMESEGTKPANKERIREVFIPAGLKKDTEIFVVDREVFHYYLIEENGSFKILTILLRSDPI